MIQPIVDFLQSQRIIILATSDEHGNPWVSNLYFTSDSKGIVYFFSANDTAHTQHIQQHPVVSWSVVWAAPDNMSNRKGIQAVGTCTQVTKLTEMAKVAGLITAKFADWKVDVQPLQNFSGKSRLYKITTTRLKYWDDELYGKEKYKEFTY